MDDSNTKCKWIDLDIVLRHLRVLHSKKLRADKKMMVVASIAHYHVTARERLLNSFEIN